MRIFDRKRTRGVRKLVGGLLLGATVAALVVAAPLTASAAGGNVLYNWSIQGAPAEGLPDLTFTMGFGVDTKHAKGLFLSQQYGLKDAGGGYIGLQPLPDVNGRGRFQAIFSNFTDGTTPMSPQCRYKADGGPGVSCSTQIDAVYGRDYWLKVSNIGESVWVGTITDSVTGVTVEIGRYRAAGPGLLRPQFSGFLEDFRPKPSDCGDLIRGTAIVGPPTTSLGLPSKIYGQYDQGICKGLANYSATIDGGGTLTARRGFVNPPVFDSTPVIGLNREILTVQVDSELASGAYRLVTQVNGRTVMESYGGAVHDGTSHANGGVTTLMTTLPDVAAGGVVRLLLVPGVPGEPIPSSMELASWTFDARPDAPTADSASGKIAMDGTWEFDAKPTADPRFASATVDGGEVTKQPSQGIAKAVNGVVTFEAAGAEAGIYTFEVTFTDDLDQTVTATYTVTVQARPTATNGSATVSIGGSSSFDAAVTGTSVIAGTPSGVPAGAAVTVSDAGEFVFDGGTAAPGVYPIEVTFTDDLSQTVTAIYTVHVVAETMSTERPPSPQPPGQEEAGEEREKNAEREPDALAMTGTDRSRSLALACELLTLLGAGVLAARLARTRLTG